MQGNCQRVETDGNCGEEANGQKSLQGIENGLLDIAASAGVFDPALKAGDNKADAEERPAKLREEQHDGLDPTHLEQLHAHVSHLGKEVSEKTHDLSVEPVHQVVHDCGCDEVPNKNI